MTPTYVPAEQRTSHAARIAAGLRRYDPPQDGSLARAPMLARLWRWLRTPEL